MPTVFFQAGLGIEQITHSFSKRTNLLSMGLVKFENAMLAVCIRFSFTIIRHLTGGSRSFASLPGAEKKENSTNTKSSIISFLLALGFPGIVLAALLLVLLTGCTTTQEIRRPDGTVEYLIACGASLGWNICYDKANQLCPGGYSTLSEDGGFNRKELRIGCPSAAKHTQ